MANFTSRAFCPRCGSADIQLDGIQAVRVIEDWSEGERWNYEYPARPTGAWLEVEAHCNECGHDWDPRKIQLLRSEQIEFFIPYRVFYARSLTAVHVAPTKAELPETHVEVCACVARDLEEVFYQMQGERWSPQGEARGLIAGLGLRHTSLSVGDGVQDPTGRYWYCDWAGWRELV